MKPRILSRWAPTLVLVALSTMALCTHHLWWWIVVVVSAVVLGTVQHTLVSSTAELAAQNPLSAGVPDQNS